jgi:hypothetical protein
VGKKGQAFQYEDPLDGVPPVSLGTLTRLPYQGRCRVCRGYFRSERARVGYCPSCHQILEDRTRELDAILAAAEGQNAEIEAQAIQKVRAALRCPILMADGYPCCWEGNRARIWPQAVPALREFLPGYVERLQRHACGHCFPGRFGVAAERRAQKQFARLCRLPVDRQPEAVKLHLRTREWLESQGINATVRWSLEEPRPKLLTRRRRSQAADPSISA